MQTKEQNICQVTMHVYGWDAVKNVSVSLILFDKRVFWRVQYAIETSFFQYMVAIIWLIRRKL